MFEILRKRGTIVILSLLMVSFTFGQDATPKISREDVISIQIGLDDAGFSCGQIDGKWGGMTRQALTAWRQANGLTTSGEFDAITAADVAKLTKIPEDWKERSELSNIWFETLLQMVAEKSYASEGLIKTLNPA